MADVERPLNDTKTGCDEPSCGRVPSDETPRAWAMIENGRYQPRRIRGSLLGRELG